MKIPVYSPVILITDKYVNDGVKKGDYGVVLDVYNVGYEVEFLDEQGNTLNVFGVEENEIEIKKNQLQNE